MAFLAPALLAGLLAITIPVIVHLVQRDRRRVVQFPSLMFLKKIPNQSVKRRALRHWPLLALRLAFAQLLALAFARPFVPGVRRPAAAGGDREVVILLDRSMSMGYGDHWERAQEEARAVVAGLGPGDRGTLVLFDTDVEIGPRSTAGPRGTDGRGHRPRRARRAATRIGPALRAAAGQLETSQLSRREVVLISDFQHTAWDRTHGRAPAARRRACGRWPCRTRPRPYVAIAGLTFERQCPGRRADYGDGAPREPRPPLWPAVSSRSTWTGTASMPCACPWRADAVATPPSARSPWAAHRCVSPHASRLMRCRRDNTLLRGLVARRPRAGAGGPDVRTRRQERQPLCDARPWCRRRSRVTTSRFCRRPRARPRPSGRLP